MNLLITLPLAYVLNVAQDDSYTLHTTARSISYAWQQAISFEQNAPLYFVVMTLWRHISSSAFFARLFSVICIALVVYLVPKIVDRYMPGLAAGWIALAVALNPFAIWAALEIRLYAFVVLLTAVLLIAFYDAFLTPVPSRAARMLYCVAAIVAAYTQYYLLFLVAAQGVVLLGRRSWGRLPSFIIVGLAVALAFVPMLLVLPGQIANFRGPYIAPPSLVASFKTLFSVVVQFPLPLLELPHFRLIYVSILAVAILSTLLLRKHLYRGGDVSILGIFAASFAIFSAAIFVAKLHVGLRHAAFLFVPAVAALYSIFSFVREPVRQRTLAVWTIVAVLFSGAALYSTYRPMAKLGDFARLSAYAMSHERPGQPIVVFQAETALPFAYYYRGPNRIVPIPQALDFKTYDVSRFVLHSDAQLTHAFGKLPTTISLVTAGACSSLNVNFGCDVLERFVRAHYATVANERFYGSRIRLLHRRQ